MLKDMKYIIVDPRLTGCDAALARYVQSQDAEPVGYAFLSPMEGPIFTTLLSAATKFDTLEQAEMALRDKYGSDPKLKVLPAIYPGDKTAQGWEQWLVVEEALRNMKRIEAAMPMHFATHRMWIAAKADYDAACKAYMETV